MPIELSDATFEDEVLKSTIPVLVDFWAPWCGPCRIAGPIVEKLAEEYEGRAKVCKLNVDDGQTTAAKYGVMSIPTICIFSGGEVVEQITGVTPSLEDDLKAGLDKLMS
ncbi:MAG: thioredoxin [Planctomycetia bacterium]|nr:thioredoxin [Planctomycetia bacterium]